MSYQSLAFPRYQPAVRIISAITNSTPAVVTTTFAAGQVNNGNQYVTGCIVRLDVPASYGMIQINSMVGTITVINDTSFSIDVDTTSFNPFIVPNSPIQYAQVVPIGTSPLGDTFVIQTITTAQQNVEPYPAS